MARRKPSGGDALTYDFEVLTRPPKRVKVTRKILQVVAELSRDGVAVLLVEQNARQALQTAARAYVLENGRVALEGSAADLRSDPHVQAAYLGGFGTIAEDEASGTNGTARIDALGSTAARP